MVPRLTNEDFMLYLPLHGIDSKYGETISVISVRMGKGLSKSDVSYSLFLEVSLSDVSKNDLSSKLSVGFRYQQNAVNRYNIDIVQWKRKLQSLFI